MSTRCPARRRGSLGGGPGLTSKRLAPYPSSLVAWGGHMRKSAGWILLSVFLNGCILDTPESGRRTSDPLPNVVVVNRLEDNAHVCPCSEVDQTTARLQIENTDRFHRARAFYAVTTSDQGGVINESLPIQVDPDLGPGERREKGCTLSPDRTIEAGASREELERVCRIRTEMRIVSSVVLDRPAARNRDAIVGKDLAESPEYCRMQCTSGEQGICLDLGRRHANLAAPFLALLDAAQSSNRSVIPISDVYRAAGISSTGDQCKRGDIHIANDRVTNSGAAACAIDRSSLAMLLSQNADEAQKFAALTGPFDTRLEIPKDVIMSRRADLAGTTGYSGTFPDSAKAFYLAFREAPLNLSLAPEVAGLNEKFGGYVRDISYARTDTGRRIVVLSTPRGCVSLDAPQ